MKFTKSEFNLRFASYLMVFMILPHKAQFEIIEKLLLEEEKKKG